MKITDKIVTSVTQPQQTNVLWHNPETGQLKIFGNNGWEVVGGGESPELPKIVESGWVLDKETLGIATKVAKELHNTCSYQSRGTYAWVFDFNPGLVTGESYELTEVGTDNKVSVVCLGNPGGPWTSENKAYAFDGDLDTSKTYSYGTYEAVLTNTASADGAVASGNGCIASGNSSHAEGHQTTASGRYSHAEGNACIGVGDRSHAEGGGTTASGYSSHAEGNGTTASGNSSHAEGEITTASGEYSHAEGHSATASGDSSHAEGSSTTASGEFSHAEGVGTTASSAYQHVQGRYNIDDSNDVYQFIIGNGYDGNRSNAFAIKWDGTIVLWKDVDTPLELTPSKLEALLALV